MISIDWLEIDQDEAVDGLGCVWSNREQWLKHGPLLERICHTKDNLILFLLRRLHIVPNSNPYVHAWLMLQSFRRKDERTVWIAKSCLYKILGWYSLMGSSDHLWWQHRAVQKTLRWKVSPRRHDRLGAEEVKNNEHGTGSLPGPNVALNGIRINGKTDHVRKFFNSAG